MAGPRRPKAVAPRRSARTCWREILLHGEDRGHDQQHDHHAEAQTVDQRDHRGFEELRIRRPLVEKRREAENGGERGQKHGPSLSHTPSMIAGIRPRVSAFSSMVVTSTMESLMMIPVIPIRPTTVNMDSGTSQTRCP
jgi:hypothetical protein